MIVFIYSDCPDSYSMDHLPPSSYQHSQLSIPYLGGPSYDNEGFDGFPQRQGYSIGKLLRGDYSGHSLGDIEAFSQSWLFFALMSQVLDCPINEADFIQTQENGLRVLSTCSYIALRDARREQEQKTWLLEKRQTWYNESRAAVTTATEYLSRLAAVALRPEIELCLSVMVSTLTFEVAHMFSSGIPTRPLVDAGGVVTNRMLMDQMRADGWCVSHVEMLASVMDAAAMYYVGTLGPPKVQKDHSRCSSSKCEADQIVESEYVTSHRTSDCRCGHLGPDMSRVRELLSSGLFPCIELTVERDVTTGEATVEIEATPFHQGNRYIALSHVWSGGLGNPQTNTLPRCQLLWLYDRMAALPREEETPAKKNTVCFWMDTLCVPLQPESARQQAIRCMRSIYTEAHAVLVLEAELLLSTAVHCTNEERLMRVSCSSWMRRLWTYQEGVLAQTIFFQFREHAVSIEELWKPLYEGSIYDRFSNGIALQGSRFYQTLRWVKKYNAPSRFLSLLDALQWRQTSKLRDECVCVAALFGLDIDQITGVPDEAKFKKLLELQGTFIKGIPFLSGPKMVEDGYGWAPLALMKRRGMDVLALVEKSHLQEVHAQWTPDGLRGEWHGFEILQSSSSSPSSTGFPETCVLSCSTDGKQYVVSRAHEPDAEDELRWAQSGGMHVLAGGAAALVLESPPTYIRKDYTSLAVLAEIRRKQDGVWFVRYKCRVVVREYLPDGEQEADRQEYAATIRDDGVERMHHGQPWCIM
jgi:Heterokaryon incompatibility protein (HET)